ncbi:TetR/AcrR family transcriptional regulator [Microbacterium arborescens]|uniref:TetR/AcrR family transcriptional regulator n=1 Tax=Microbacterium arborescens TaxID=33883 RepID=UPI0027872A57|nr:TetR/AcrR family transcriptional regulator [Microbacterium arborescens]MDQ1217281.1 AcrR family transcriptional regulator [Microbacterium arborescens]
MPSPGDRRRGRPPAHEQAARDARIIAVAARLFVAVGFHAASLDAIAQEAGVTKRTIYDRIGDKPALLRAAVTDVHGYLDIRARDLRHACTLVATALFADRAVGLHRAAVAVALDDPAISRAFYDAGPLAAQRYLASQLGGDERRAAHLFGALLGEPHRRRLLGLDPEPTAASLDAHVTAVLDAFTEGLRAAPPAQFDAAQREAEAGAD